MSFQTQGLDEVDPSQSFDLPLKLEEDQNVDTETMADQPVLEEARKPQTVSHMIQTQPELEQRPQAVKCVEQFTQTANEEVPVKRRTAST